jgi:MFS family permease
VIIGWLFIRHTKRSEAPFIPYKLIAGKGFSAMNLLNTLYGTAVFGFGALAPLYAENRYHIGLSTAGTMQSARSLGMVSVAGVAAMMLRRTGYRRPMILGFLVFGAGLFMMSVSPRGLSPYWWLVAFAFLAGMGMGSAAPATNNALLQLAPDNVAAITGLRAMFRQSGGILYISVATALLARSSDPGILQAHLFIVQAGVFAGLSLLTFRVPDHKGAW